MEAVRDGAAELSFAPPGRQPGSAAFRRSKAEVMELGAAHSTKRTPQQTEIAHYWSDAIGTYAPAGHWNAIAANIVGPLKLGLSVEAELFAELNVAMADAGIAMADAKYTYWMLRPDHGHPHGDNARRAGSRLDAVDGNPGNHPSYISGHASFSGAAAAVMTAWFGDRPFSFSSASLPGVIAEILQLRAGRGGSRGQPDLRRHTLPVRQRWTAW